MGAAAPFFLLTQKARKYTEKGQGRGEAGYSTELCRGGASAYAKPRRWGSGGWASAYAKPGGGTGDVGKPL